MKRNDKKNDKIKILLIFLLVYAGLSWVFMGSTYQSGELVKIGWYRAGLFDLVAVIFSGLTYKIEDILYILAVGGMYGILTHAESYKRIVSKLSNVVKNNGVVSFIVITFIVGLYTALSSNIITLFILVPLIMTVFLKAGYDKLTAVGASFGGLFLGYLGQIVGTYGNEFIYQYFQINANLDVVVKIVLFLVAFVLFNVFGVLHLRNNQNVELGEESDIYAVSEPKHITRRSEQIMTWPTIVVAIISLLVIMIGYIPWSSALGVTLFDKLHSAVMNFSIGNIKIVETLIGSTMTAIGAWSDFLPAIFMMIIFVVVVCFTNNISFREVCNNLSEGMKKIAGVAFMYGLAFSFLYMATAYPWPTTIVNFFIKTDGYNLFFIILGLIAAFLAVVFCADPLFSGYYYGQYLSAIFTVNLGITAILWRVGSGLALLVGPTSFLLIAALTYADIPYTKWLKYIWKFALTFFVATILVLGIVIM